MYPSNHPSDTSDCERDIILGGKDITSSYRILNTLVVVKIVPASSQTPSKSVVPN